MIQLASKHIEAMKKHAETDYPYECCGILIGTIESDQSKRVEQVLSISNARDVENRHNRYLITPEEILKTELYAQKHRMDIVGFYHSHPDHEATPSAYDVEHAWPFYSYFIVSIEKGKADNFTVSQLSEDRLRLDTELIKQGE